MSTNEGKEFEQVMEKALPPEPGEIGDPDHGFQLDFDPGPAPEDDGSLIPSEINDEEDTVDDEASS